MWFPITPNIGDKLSASVETTETQSKKRQGKVAISKGDVKYHKLLMANMRSKRGFTLLKKGYEFCQDTNMSCFVVVKDVKGNYSVCGSPDLEQRALLGKPIFNPN